MAHPLTPYDPVTRFQELFAANPELAAPLRSIADPATAAETLARIGAANGIATNAAEIRRHIDAALANAQRRGELSDDELDGVAGGTTALMAVLTSLSAVGAGCLFGGG